MLRVTAARGVQVLHRFSTAKSMTVASLTRLESPLLWTAARAEPLRMLSTATFPRTNMFSSGIQVQVLSADDNTPDAAKVTFMVQEELQAKGVPAHLQTAGAVLHAAASCTQAAPQLWVSLGPAEKVTESRISSATCGVMKTLKSLGVQSVVFSALPKTPVAAEAGQRRLVQAALLSTYQFDKYKSAPTEEPKPRTLQRIVFDTANDASLKALVHETAVVCNGTVLARDLANERSDVAHPDFIGKFCEDLCAANAGLNCVTYDVNYLQANGANLICAVGAAAVVPPRIVCIEYMPEGKDKEPIVLLGKGITFDTGGLNLKPTGSIETMYMDKGGASAVIGTMMTLASLGVKRNVVGAVALAENAIGSRAYKPSAVIKSMKGLTVEIGNTDAEGRLALADAMTLTQRVYKPKVLVDVATLTGACVVALGEHAAGLFSNNTELSAALLESGKSQHERCWALPILPEHREELSCEHADVKSTGSSRNGGSSTAAAFLEKFIEPEVQWAHVDIAGPAMYSAAREYFPKGATGFGVQLLTDFVRRYKA